MDSIKATIEIIYEKPLSRTQLMAAVKDIFHIGPPTQKGLSLENINGIKISPKNSSILVGIEKSRVVFTYEGSDTALDVLRKKINELHYEKFNSHTKRGKISRIGIRTLWVKEVKNFSDLLDRSKEVFYRPTPLVENATDVALVLTFEKKREAGKKAAINYNYGPMKKDQLFKQYLIFKERKDIPNSFAFVDVDYSVQGVDYSKKFFYDFLTSGFKEGHEKAQQTFNILELK